MWLIDPTHDPAQLTAVHSPEESLSAPRFDLSYARDLDVDDRPEEVSWSKPPLELALRTSNGTRLRMIGVHAKSKAPHGAKDAQDALRLSIANRRKQLAQCLWLRARVDDHFAANEQVMVLGDFNDGPGLDQFEKLFGQSGVEIVMGQKAETALYDPHAAGARTRPGSAQISTARFFDRRRGHWFSALLDFIMLSPGLMARRPSWKIWHPFDDPSCFSDAALRTALLTASDHFPVVLEIDI